MDRDKANAVFTEFGPLNSESDGETTSEFSSQPFGNFFNRFFKKKTAASTSDVVIDSSSSTSAREEDEESFLKNTPPETPEENCYPVHDEATQVDAALQTKSSVGSYKKRQQAPISSRKMATERANQKDSIAQKFASFMANARSSSNLSGNGIDSSANPLKDYNESSFRRYWMPDSGGKECYDCQEKFTTFRRRHHCRICGQIFCSKCCYQAISGHLLGYTGELRLCTYCSKYIIQYLEESGKGGCMSLKVIGASSSDLQQDHETALGTDLAKSCCSLPTSPDGVAGEHTSAPSSAPVRKISLASAPEARPWGFYLGSPPSTLTGADSSSNASSSTFNVEQGRSSNTSESLDNTGSTMETIPGDNENVVDISYDEDIDEPEWLKMLPEIHADEFEEPDTLVSPYGDNFRSPIAYSSYGGPSPLRRKSVLSESDLVHGSDALAMEEEYGGGDDYLGSDLFRRPGTLSLSSHNFALIPEVSDMTRKVSIMPRTPLSDEEKTSLNKDEKFLEDEMTVHQQRLLRQLLYRKNLSDAWFGVLWPLARKIAFTVKPNVKDNKDDMDIRTYIHVKCLESNTTTPKANVVFGTVFSKSIADSRMAKSYFCPKILLIRGSIEYERTPRFCSLEPVLSQESEYLLGAVSKIASLSPHVMVVEKSVARTAQQYIHDVGITLLCNVKPSILRRIERCTGAQVVASVDAVISRPRLGTAGYFKTESFEMKDGMKSLTFFEDCQPDLACSVILCHQSKAELRAAKELLKNFAGFLLSGRLEVEFLKMCGFLSPNSQELILLRANNEDSPVDPCVTCIQAMASPLALAVPGHEGNKERGSLRDYMNEALLSSSPFIRFRLPYLETNSGQRSLLRRYFRGEIFPFDRGLILSLSNAAPSETTVENGGPLSQEDDDKENEHPSGIVGLQVDTNYDAYKRKEELEQYFHPFVQTRIVESAKNPKIKNMLASYRARGGQLLRQRMKEERKHESKAKKSPTRKVTIIEPSGIIDAFNPFLHQRIAVLFSSYSLKSSNAPGFCISPWVVIMEFYGRNDICLGDFLERYCFSSKYNCPSPSCDSSMLSHVRKIVHGNGMVEITVQQVTDSPDPPKSAGLIGPKDVGTGNQLNGVNKDGQGVVFWTWCFVCKATSNPNILAHDPWHLSFAKFLDYVFSCEQLPARKADGPCPHCLFHQHCYYFAKDNLVASFRYSPINLNEIVFPPRICFVQSRIVDLEGFVKDTKDLLAAGGTKFVEVQEQIQSLESKIVDVPSSNFAVLVTELTALCARHRERWRHFTNEIQVGLTDFLGVKERVSFHDPDYIAVVANMLRSQQELSNVIQAWNSTIQEFYQAMKRQKAVDNEKVMLLASENPAANGGGNEPMSSLSTESTGESSFQCPGRDTGEVEKVPRASLDSVALTASADKRKSAARIPLPGFFNRLFDATVHYSLPFGFLPIVINDEQISSIIAYTLSSNEYAEKIKVARGQFLERDVVVTLKISGNYDGTTGSAGGGPNVGGAGMSGPGGGPEGSHGDVNALQHIELQFSDSGANFYCKVYFAEHFRLLRKIIFEQGEDAFIRSLASCIPWKPKGGKSGATFFKTSDDRFVIKQMSRFEMQSFLKFAPNYFHYISTACTEEKLTALAKIFGVFRVGFRNSDTGSAEKIDVFVTENLFYRKNVSRVFDLKGSMRKRMVSEKHANPELVYLDENLLKKACQSPLYIYPHTKTALNIAIANDSHFLSGNLVMDYSLLVGVDEENLELIIGIVDYIRTYTWDKRLETWVKSVGVYGSLPTVISPELYCQRFCEAMDTYFLVAPDQWAGLSYGISY